MQHSTDTAPSCASADFESQQLLSGKTTVYYDGACPLCLKEVGFYKRKDSNRLINWIDVTRCEPSLLGDGLNRESALKRFHARSPEGRLYSGAEAFAEIWSTLPGFNWLGRIAKTRFMGEFMEVLYRGFLFIRPGIQRIYRRSNR